MKSTRRFALAAGLAALLAAGTTLAMDRCDRASFASGGYGMLGAVYQLDNLTAAQRTQIDALRDQHLKQQTQWREDRQALRDAMNGGADAKTIKPLADKAGKNTTAMIIQKAEARAALDKILTDPQRDQLKTLVQERPRHRGYGGGKLGS